LSKSLGSQDINKHRACVGWELEVLAKKFDRFGWERDRNTLTQDRVILDWIAELQDYPIGEIRGAIAATIRGNPDRMPNEGHVYKQIMKARQQWMNQHPKTSSAVIGKPRIVSDEQKHRADQIVKDAGFSFRRRI
jgi:hypothetical protein